MCVPSVICGVLWLILQHNLRRWLVSLSSCQSRLIGSLSSTKTIYEVLRSQTMDQWVRVRHTSSYILMMFQWADTTRSSPSRSSVSFPPKSDISDSTLFREALLWSTSVSDILSWFCTLDSWPPRYPDRYIINLSFNLKVQHKLTVAPSPAWPIAA